MYPLDQEPRRLEGQGGNAGNSTVHVSYSEILPSMNHSCPLNTKTTIRHTADIEVSRKSTNNKKVYPEYRIILFSYFVFSHHRRSRAQTLFSVMFSYCFSLFFPCIKPVPLLFPRNYNLICLTCVSLLSSHPKDTTACNAAVTWGALSARDHLPPFVRVMAEEGYPVEVNHVRAPNRAREHACQGAQ